MKKSRKILTILIGLFLIVGFSNSLRSQEVEREYTQKRYVVGSGFGFQFGTITVIELSPEIGYKITDNLTTGVGFSYQYYKDSRYIPEYKSNIIGGSVFARYYVYRDFFAHAEYQMLKYDYMDWSSGNEEEVTADGILVGAGYRQWIGKNVFSNLTVLFNINESLYYPYTSPIFRVGVYFLF
ncbi:MAG: hypothetical protein K8R41_03420 [Bacteroidales bacterium]|nr:hypothetical protein [Bacteroidales bacterium]